MEDQDVLQIRTNRREISLSGRPLIMGILNVTPDSFSDGGKFVTLPQCMARIDQMIEEGADIIDVGGESSRPGAFPIPESEEKSRVLPVIRECAKHYKTPLSIDTWKPGVARAAVAEGAEIINDITGLSDPEMVELARKTAVAVVAMHMRGRPWNMSELTPSPDIMSEIRSFFAAVMQLPLGASQIILDPGVGFGKTPEDNLVIQNRVREFTGYGRPVMLGLSRKSFIGHVSGAPVENRLPGSIAAAVLAVMNGVHILRCHDVAPVIQAIAVARAILSEVPV